MAIQVALRFVTGQYHATAWDHAVNEGLSEWPPSPWRVLRGIVSTWHTRCPGIPKEVVQQVVAALAAEPPSYLLPPTSPSQTRHYMPNPGHLEGVKRDTSLQLAPRLTLDPGAELVVAWPSATLDAPAREALAHLVAQLPYLGRAESRCAARLLPDAEHQPVDERWARPAEHGEVPVLAPVPGVTVSELEVTAYETRRSRLRYPSSTRWIPYVVPQPELPPVVGSDPRLPTAVRWRLDSPAPFRADVGILAAEGLRGRILGSSAENERLRETGSGVAALAGHQGGPRQHRHAHWLWLPAPDRGDRVQDVVLWAPDGIPADVLGRVAGARHLPRFSYAPKGYVGGAALHLQVMGPVAVVAPELVSATCTRWVSVTPFLTDRRPKRNRSRTEFAQRLVERELGFRHPDGFGSVRVEVLADWEDRETVRFRRYRWQETMADRRRGMRLRLELDAPLPQGPAGPEPLSLGSLSHFGFGLFQPDEP